MSGKRADELFLPNLVEPEPGIWTGQEVDIQDSAVDTQNRKYWVPQAHTQAQRLARLHELGHVRYSPRDWPKRVSRATSAAMARIGKPIDPRAVDKIQHMLEENRIDWILWDRHGIDLRPSREVLDWAKMPDPDNLLSCLGMSLQLAWTVWASRGLGTKGGVPNPPPVRTVDTDTAEYFDKCWRVVLEENEELAKAMIRGCTRMYSHPTHEMRDKVAAELSTFFPLEEEPEEKPPPPKKREQQEQDRAEEEEQALQEIQNALETGIGSEVVTEGGIQYHDHTATVRRLTMRIARREVPVTRGPGLRFPGRYFIDKAIFGQRLLTEAGIMVDGSGSMKWTDEDMQELVLKLPAVRVGVYSGVDNVHTADGEQVYGRICIIAKDGRFARYDGLDKECNGSNDVDYEGLQLLARWPKPRFWLSDGAVCGGRHTGPAERHETIGWYEGDGKLHELCDSIMRAHDILRVPDRDTMHRLLKRERVTVYRSSTPSVEWLTQNGSMHSGRHIRSLFPEGIDPMPIQFQL